MKDLKEGLKEAEGKMKQLAEDEVSHMKEAQNIQIEMLTLKGRIGLLKELIEEQKNGKNAQ